MSKLKTLKALLQIPASDTSQDALFEIYLDMTEQSVLNYVNRRTLPDELQLTVVRLTAETLRTALNQKAAESGDGKVSSVSMPGMSISYGADNIDLMLLKASLDNRITTMQELNSFRLVVRPPIGDNGDKTDY